MRGYFESKLSRFWMRLATCNLGAGGAASYKLRPGDEERLIAALIDMNALLARVARI
jgi:hypothetical protein